MVITGLGISCRNDVNSFWTNIINGNSGIDYITKFNTDFKVRSRHYKYFEEKAGSQNGPICAIRHSRGSRYEDSKLTI